MLYDLPDDATLYRALLDRDPSWEGRAWVGVTSTGIFCRLTCPARKPLPRNCCFHGTPAACLAAGFRPCLRCKPLEAVARSEPIVARLLTELDAAPDRLWRERDLAGMGLDPSTVRRAFRRHLGATFLEIARHRRLRDGAGVLAAGGRVIDAQLEAGFESGAAFREAMARLLGRAPAALDAAAPVRVSWIATPLGDMVVAADGRAVHLLEFIGRRALPRELRAVEAAAGGLGLGRTPAADALEAQLGAYFAGLAFDFDLPLIAGGTAFEQTVWDALRRVPVGETRSYGALAEAIGRPGAARAVARANGANRIALLVPCHRVIGADGELTGYGGGLGRKRALIELEQAHRARLHASTQGTMASQDEGRVP
jgi:AraC family transcriptional regulator of adaptative response/methylated-DNA-[protein]-cysteine methyltransferase